MPLMVSAISAGRRGGGRRRSRAFLTGVVLSAWVVPAVALAPARTDAVERRGGTVVTGEIVTLTPGSEIVLMVLGERVVVPWSDVVRVSLDEVLGPAPVPASASQAAPPPTSGSAPSASRRDSPALGPERGSRRRQRLDVSPSALSGESVQDCAEHASERCRRSSEARLDASGASLSVRQERVTAVTSPRHTASFHIIGANGIVGGGKEIQLYGGGVRYGFRLLAGSLFPDRRGGTWGGIYFGVDGAFSSVATRIETTTTGEYGQLVRGTQESDSRDLQFTTGLGVELLTFGEVDGESLKQRGFGVALGGQVGSYQSLSNGSKATLTYGPVLSLVRPSYNPGTAQLSTFQLDAFVFPTKELTVATIGLGIGF